MSNAVLVATIGAAFTLATPITYTALGGVISERGGVINVALEGIMLGGCFGFFVGAHVSNGPWGAAFGMVAAIAVGMAMAGVLAYLSVGLGVNQVVVGIAIDIAALGITSFLFRSLYTNDSGAVYGINATPIPGLDRIPVIGPSVFDQPGPTYFAVVLVVAVWFLFGHTKAGLWLRAVGESPEAADVVGIHIARVRYVAVLAAGALGGAGGGLLLAQVRLFGEDMTNGLGFIALAAVIIGRWEPLGAAVACLGFGAFQALQTGLQVAGVHAPYQLFVALPYVATVVILSLPIRRARPPAAEGIPYLKS